MKKFLTNSTRTLVFQFLIGLGMTGLLLGISFFVSEYGSFIENDRPLGLAITPLIQTIIVIFIFAGFYTLGLLKKYPIISILVLSGGLSNLIERLAFGYVRDYININIAYINMADLFIWTGLLALNAQIWVMPYIQILQNKIKSKNY